MGSNDPSDREDVALSTSELDDVLSSAEIRSESGNDEESGLEKYGIWIKVEPETLAAEPETALELGELESGPAGVGQLTAEEEQLLGELESEAQEPAAKAETADFEGLEKDLQELDASAGEQPEEEAADLDLDLEELALEPGKGPEKEREIEVPLSDSLPELDSLEEAPEAEPRGAEARSSEAILKKIEQDLKQIKLEIQNLKKELSGRGGEAPRDAAAPGFFPEEEDDSIALTGDELDNILNTADFTEEQAGGPAPEEELPEAELPEAELPEALVDLQEAVAAEPALPADELPEAELPEVLEDLQEAAPAAENLDLLEPGSLSAEPEAAPIELEEKAADLELETLEEEAAPELELEELEPDSASELVLEEPAPLAEGLEEAPPAEEALSLEELGEEPATEALELEPLAEAEAAPAESLELAEELPDLSLADEQAPAETLELVEEAGEAEAAPAAGPSECLPEDLREDVKSVLSYLDQLLEALPDDKIRQFAQSEYFGVYKRLFEELGLGA
jgi:hypothetical protein